MEEVTFITSKSKIKDSLKKNKKDIPFIYIIIAILVVALAVLSYLYISTKTENKELKNNQESLAESSEEYKEISEKISTLMDIAEDENLNIARVDDPKVLLQQNEEFYEDVKEGHYLVVMPKSQRIVIFDKEKNRIVNFSSYSIRVDVIPEENIAQSEKPLNIEIRYTNAVTQETIERVQQILREASQNYNIVDVSETSVNHKGLSVVLLNRASKPNMSQNIIAHSGTNTIFEVLPEGEPASNADVVLLIGNNN